jgi:hypothetical protein
VISEPEAIAAPLLANSQFNTKLLATCDISDGWCHPPLTCFQLCRSFLLFGLQKNTGITAFGWSGGYCSFSATQKKHTLQAWRQCRTCGLVDNAGVCVACAETCHAGHDLGEERITNFFCDCGAEGVAHCRSVFRFFANDVIQ